MPSELLCLELATEPQACAWDLGPPPRNLSSSFSLMSPFCSKMNGADRDRLRLQTLTPMHVERSHSLHHALLEIIREQAGVSKVLRAMEMMKNSNEESLWARDLREAFLEEEASVGGGLWDLEGTGQPCTEALQTGKTA